MPGYPWLAMYAIQFIADVGTQYIAPPFGSPGMKGSLATRR